MKGETVFDLRRLQDEYRAEVRESLKKQGLDHPVTEKEWLLFNLNAGLRASGLGPKT
jgi:hypothetical protein